MSNIPTIDAIHEEKTRAAPKWVHPNEILDIGIEQISNGANSEKLASRSMPTKRMVQRKENGYLEMLCGWIVGHQIGLTINLLMLLFLTHLCFPRARIYTRKFFALSYYNPSSGKYSLGLNDACMVSFWVVAFTGLRAAVMDYILIPLAKKGGVKTMRNQTRYMYRHTRVAHLIMCIMDVIDLFFPTAKCLKYLNHPRLSTTFFAFFLIAWITCRHIAFITVIHSVYAHTPLLISLGCYQPPSSLTSTTGPFPPPNNLMHLFEPFTNPGEGIICWTETVKWGFLSALLFLQGLTLVWFGMIVRVTIKVLRGEEATDTRSDDEGSTDQEETPEIIEELDEVGELQPLEEEVGVEGLNLRGRGTVVGPTMAKLDPEMTVTEPGRGP
ncbi:hypothetical protein G7Y89_g6265 [Cudoniella acicularis]|uniref:TLC domain-containing protein n=1 Tax=Cudoniella acicularis TaxID=354080 RepID=A0A8H4RLN1_9HELO|nr:hypothetical protein G7Y89_g6265 [Cudoniella acicularis]